MILLAGKTEPTRREMLQAEGQILDHMGGEAVLWCGRGATALRWAYRLAALAFSRPVPEIILPAIGCASLASTALASGVIPRFADVDVNTGMPGLEDLKRVYTERTCAVLYCHLFGNTGEMRSIQDWCRQCNITLIEDVVQSLGAQLPSGEPAGEVGDLAVCSFSRTKLIGCGGGALIIRSKELRAIMESAKDLLPSVSELPIELEDALERSYRDIQFGLIALMRSGQASNLAAQFLPLQHYYEPLWVRPFQGSTQLPGCIADLQQSLTRRRLKAEIYVSGLEGGPWKILRGWSQSGVCWRLSLLLDDPDYQIPLSEAVRSDGFHVSNLYWPLNLLFSQEDAAPAAEHFARRVINLWVDDSVSHDWVRACAHSLLKRARELQ